MRIRRTLLSFALAAGVVAPALGGAEIISTAQPAGACPLLGCSGNVIGILQGGSIVPAGDGSETVQASYIGLVLNAPVLVTGRANLFIAANGRARLFTIDTFGTSFSTGNATVTKNGIIFTGGGATATFIASGNSVLGGHLSATETFGTT